MNHDINSESINQQKDYGKSIDIKDDDMLDLETLSQESNSSFYIKDLIKRLHLSWSAGVPFMKGKNYVSKPEIMVILTRSMNILHAEPNVLNLTISSSESDRLTVVGDTHGQFYDLLSIFKANGMPGNKNIYLFNGDFVDRGPFSFQVIFLLLSLKILFPDRIYLLRGNHESEKMNMSYGFSDEILAKYDTEVLETFWLNFRCLPLAAIITQKQDVSEYRAFVVHGGIVSPEKLSLVNRIERYNFNSLKNEEKKIFLDLLWSDPQKQIGRRKNRARGAGSRFGPDETKRFLSEMGLNLVVRSHQVKRNGFAFMHDNLCLTIFSCPNYCDRHRNKGAYLVFSKKTNLPEIVQFSAAEHPPLSTRAFSSKL